MIQVMTGRSGSGKTKKLYEDLAEMERKGLAPGKAVWLIVPEQFTLQAERELVSFQGLEGLLSVRVLSFRKLVDQILEATEASEKVFLDALGRHMLIKRILIETVHDLEAYQAAHRKPGFIEMMGDFLAELKRSGVGVSQLREASERLPALTGAKLKDIALVLERFEAYKSDKLMDEEDRYALAADRMSSLAELHGTTVCLDGFSGFTGQEFSLIEALASISGDLRVALTLDPVHLNREGIFLATAETYRRLEKIAQETGCGFNVRHFHGTDAVSPPLRHIEQYLFEFPQKVYDGDPDGVRLLTFDSIWEEAEFTALEIRRLVTEKGYRFQDIAVVSNAPELYDDPLKRMFTLHRIPMFHDNRRDIAGNPLARLILGMLEAYQKDFRPGPLFRALKTGLTPLTREEWERLEIYAIEQGMMGRRWQITAREESVEALREKLMHLITSFRTAFQETDTAIGYSSALFNWLTDAGIKDRYEAKIAEINRFSGFEAAYEMIQGWNMISDLLDQIVAVSPESSMKLKDYRAILEAGFAAYETGMLPQAVDTVLIGKVEHSRSHPIRALFVVGTADGILPSNRDGSGLLTEDEKLSLRACQLELKSVSDYLSMNEAFSIYLAMAKPSEALYVSCGLADGMGRAMRPSYLFERLAGLFSENAKVQRHLRLDELPPALRASSFHAVLPPVTRHLRAWLDGRASGQEKAWASILNYYEAQPEFEARIHQLRRAFDHHNRPKPLAPDLAEALFGAPLTTSVSRLERYAACPFKHYVDFGLRPARLVPYEVDLPEVGRLFHSTVEAFALRALADGSGKRPDSPEEVSAMIGEIVEAQVAAMGKTVYEKSERDKYILRRVKRTSTRAALTILDHLRHSHFTPKAYELAFSEGRRDSLPPILIELSNGQTLLLEGRIDRVDLLETESGTAFVQIVDYKSGAAALDLSQIHHGLQLQLVTYMDAVLNDPSCLTSMPKVAPGGLFYFKIDDPMVDLDSVNEADLEREILKKLKLTGLIIGGPEMAKQLDADLEAEAKSVRIPFELKKDGLPTAASSVLEPSVFESLRRFVRRKIASLGAQILSGEIDVSPYRFGNKTACDHCDLLGLCQFDLSYGQNRYRNLRKMTDLSWVESDRQFGEKEENRP